MTPESERIDNCCCNPCGFPNNQFPLGQPPRRRNRQCADPAQFIGPLNQCVEIPFFGNDQQVAVAGCSSGAGDDVTVGVGSNTVFSHESVDDANVAAYEYALQSAEAQVQCNNQFFSAAQTANAVCPNGQVQQYTSPVGAYVSQVSQVDADTQAYNLAFAKAQSLCGQTEAPSFTQQPSSVSIFQGQSATLTVQVLAIPAAAYQWFSGHAGDASSPIPGATGSTYITPLLSSTAFYWVMATNAAGSVNSSTATVTVASPAIQTQPTGGSTPATPSGVFTLSVVVSGAVNPTYQWYVGLSGNTSSPIGGATGSTYNAPTSSLGSVNYWVQFTNAYAQLNSTTATVTATANPPVISSVFCTPPNPSPDGSCLFTVVATGVGTLAYQWYQGVSGATTTPVGFNQNTYTVDVPLSGSFPVWCRVTGPYGSADSTTVYPCIGC